MEQTAVQKKVISGFGLKMVAVISMLIDHTAATILERILFGEHVPDVYRTGGIDLYTLYYVMRTIGRLAFPIYCFLLVEGFSHTKSVKKYALRLFVFALLSELPFDWALMCSVWDISYNNVFFTLFIGLVTIAGIDRIRKQEAFGNFAQALLALLVSAAGMGLAYLLATDYNLIGVAVIVCMYLLRDRPVASYAAGALVLTVLGGLLEAAAFAVVPLLLFYNGKRGRQAKYFFYAFYPLHLLLLGGICRLMGL